MKRRTTHKLVASLLFTLLLLTSLGKTEAKAQAMKVKAKLDTTQIFLGDQIYLQLEIEKSQGVDIQFPELTDSITSTIEVISQEPTQTFEKDGKQVISRRYLITSFDSGQHVIPPLYFHIKTKDMDDSIKSKSLVLNVASFDVDLQKGAVDIKKPYDAKITFKEAVPYILGVIFVIGLVLLICYAVYRYRNQKAFFTKPPAPKEPEHIIALRELNQMKEKETWKTMESKHFFSEVTNVLRVYMEDRFKIQAMESTTDEILQAIKQGKHLGKDKETLAELTQVLQLADLVKFAKLTASEDECRLSLANAVFFVNKTKRKEKVETERPQKAKEEDRSSEEN